MAADRDVEIVKTTAEFVAELRRLADALESGAAYSIDVDGEEVTLPEGAILSVEHEREEGEEELEFQIKWTLPETDEAEEKEPAESEEAEQA